MERYAAAKALLFKRAKRFCILNRDDEWFETFHAASAGKTIQTYGSKKADTKLVSSNITASGASFVIENGGKKHSFFIKLTGMFNVYNAMAAITTAWLYGISDEEIQKGFDALDNVPGRMQAIDEGQDFTVIIDHAHTPDALDNLYRAVKPTVKSKLIIVNGCDGDRDPKKRFPIGAMTARIADVFYLTEIENYTEDPKRIFDMVREGIMSVPEAERAEIIEIHDREEAINAAIRRAKAGDVVLIPGVGAQDYRGMADASGAMVKIPWDDREVARKALRNRHHK
jgi:UDP-N-acetylmuramoyl-L-alanyl-D-glutamate--2,6-diaminopimelate ligase